MARSPPSRVARHVRHVSTARASCSTAREVVGKEVARDRPSARLGRPLQCQYLRDDIVRNTGQPGPCAGRVDGGHVRMDVSKARDVPKQRGKRRGRGPHELADGRAAYRVFR